MKNTIVLSAFPGLWKTTFFNKCKESNISVLDSDSINFSWLEGGTDRDGSNETRVRNPDFPNNYIEHIKENIGKVDVILVSSHKVVRDALNAEGIKYFVVYPNISLKEEYIERYIKRNNPVKFVEMMHTNFESFVSELDNEIQIFQTKIKIDEPEIYLSKIFEEKIKIHQQNKINNIEPIHNITPGKYDGLWSAYYVVIIFANGKKSKPIKLNIGVRGVNCSCKVEVDSIGNITVY